MKQTYVHPWGDTTAKLALVGEQPGKSEVLARPPKPFLGPAGRALDECLQMTKIPRSSLYLTNVIKDLDKPLKHYISIDNRGRETIHPEGYQYIKELGEELRALNLNCVVALGNIALLALTNRIGITKWRGSILESTLVPNLKVIGTFHPATIIPPKFNYLNKPLICEDLIKAKKESEFPDLLRLSRNIHIKPSFAYAIVCLDKAFEEGINGQLISFDIEIINEELDCFSIGWSPVESISIPIRGPQGDYFSPDQELEILKALARIIEEPKISKVNANIIFDLQFMARKYNIVPRGPIHCTQIAQKISFPDFPAGLDFVTTMHTDIPYYKADGKKWMRMQSGSWEQWWTYSGMDALAPLDAFPKQMQELSKQNNLETYERQRKLISPLLYMAERGIKVDVTSMAEYKDQQQEILNSLALELNDVVGYSINYNSPQQLAKYFYEDCNLQLYKSRNTRGEYKVTTNIDALKRIFRKGGKGSQAARLMLDIRSLSKRISTYLEIGKIDPDGRMRSSYKPVGTETGRISSGETIFGTGSNQQNWPHDLLRFFTFDKDYLGYSFDLSQIENRIVAYAGGVISQIEAFENNIDLHTMTASIIFNKSYDQISSEDGSSILGDGRQSERYWGKKSNHALNYDTGYKKFALVNELTETEAKHVMAMIHQGYPQIRGGYHQMIVTMLKKNRMVTNPFGRTRLFLGPIIPSGYSTPLSMCEATYREAYAHFAQSTCADKINEQGVEFIYYNQQWFKPIELLTQIHDSVVFQIPLSLPWIEHARMLLLIKSSLETPVIWKDREIPTPVDLSIGFNMCKDLMIEIKSANMPGSPELLAEKLEEIHLQLTQGANDELP